MWANFDLFGKKCYNIIGVSKSFLPNIKKFQQECECAGGIMAFFKKKSMTKQVAPKARRFSDVLAAVKKEAPQELKDYLDKSAGFWAPEIVWERLTEAVQRFVVPDSKNPVSVKVYSELSGLSTEEIEKIFVADGY